MPNSSFGILNILIVEDSSGDISLIQESLRDAKFINSSHIVKDGVEAMKFLHKIGEFTHAPRPNLIILDLNLPKKDGREVLSEIKTDIKLKTIPVVIFTTSQAEEDIITTYNLHANCYITKPLDFNQFKKVIQSIDGFWFSIAKLPPVE